MATVKHTPIPWDNTHIFSGEEVIRVSDGTEKPQMIGRILLQKDAEFIVLACNSHEELVRTLIISTNEHRKTQIHLHSLSGKMSKPLQDIIDGNEKVITKVEEK